MFVRIPAEGISRKAAGNELRFSMSRGGLNYEPGDFALNELFEIFRDQRMVPIHSEVGHCETGEIEQGFPRFPDFPELLGGKGSNLVLSGDFLGLIGEGRSGHNEPRERPHWVAFFLAAFLPGELPTPGFF